MFCGDVSFMHTKHVFDRKKLIINHFLGGYIFLCLPPYNANFRYFEIKYAVPKTSNLQDSTVQHFSLSILNLYYDDGVLDLLNACGNNYQERC